jgi:hypothetical protein
MSTNFKKYKREQLMKKLIERFSGLVKSTLSGFDRIVFKGLILSLMSAVRFRSAGILAPIFNRKNMQLATSQGLEMGKPSLTDCEKVSR